MCPGWRCLDSTGGQRSSPQPCLRRGVQRGHSGGTGLTPTPHSHTRTASHGWDSALGRQGHLLAGLGGTGHWGPRLLTHSLPWARALGQSAGHGAQPALGGPSLAQGTPALSPGSCWAAGSQCRPGCHEPGEAACHWSPVQGLNKRSATVRHRPASVWGGPCHLCALPSCLLDRRLRAPGCATSRCPHHLCGRGPECTRQRCAPPMSRGRHGTWDLARAAEIWGGRWGLGRAGHGEQEELHLPQCPGS